MVKTKLTDQDPNKIYNDFWRNLVQDIDADRDNFPYVSPYLAHYTSLDVLEGILKNQEIWFSNPLFMNDYEELRYGVNEGFRAVLDSTIIKDAFEDKDSYPIFIDSYQRLYEEFSNLHAIDVYAFCLSVHEIDADSDGKLSMWRGYGGNGKGVSIVLDSKNFKLAHGSPFIISKVSYVSNQARYEWMQSVIQITADFIKSNQIDRSFLHLIAIALFERIKIAALFSKHIGFKEEREWRVVYLRQRDTEQKYEKFVGHIITSKGVEPKFKLKLNELDASIHGELSLDKLIHQIILGPSISSGLALTCVTRMLQNLKFNSLTGRVKASNIPYRN